MNHRNLSVRSVRAKKEPVPMICLTGNWLAENGFKTGRPIHVYASPGNLSISLILPEDESPSRTDS